MQRGAVTLRAPHSKPRTGPTQPALPRRASIWPRNKVRSPWSSSPRAHRASVGCGLRPKPKCRASPQQGTPAGARDWLSDTRAPPQQDRPPRLPALLKPALHHCPLKPHVPAKPHTRHRARPRRLPYPRHRHPKPLRDLARIQQPVGHRDPRLRGGRRIARAISRAASGVEARVAAAPAPRLGRCACSAVGAPLNPRPGRDRIPHRSRSEGTGSCSGKPSPKKSRARSTAPSGLRTRTIRT